ncbi:hypothetical protein BC938DRAFT_481494, partial [Jimgerdemannia flammicorona]
MRRRLLSPSMKTAMNPSSSTLSSSRLLAPLHANSVANGCPSTKTIALVLVSIPLSGICRFLQPQYIFNNRFILIERCIPNSKSFHSFIPLDIGAGSITCQNLGNIQNHIVLIYVFILLAFSSLLIATRMAGPPETTNALARMLNLRGLCTFHVFLYLRIRSTWKTFLNMSRFFFFFLFFF